MSKKMDGILLKKLDPMRKLMPYLFKTRNGSIIYAPVEIDMEAAQIYLSQIKANPNLEQITIFELVVAALLRTYAKYPYLNRYISNKKIYGRQSFSISFVVLKNDQHKLKESIAKVYLSLDDDVFTVSRKIKEAIEQCRHEPDKEDDNLMTFVSKLPSPILSAIVYLVEKLSHTAFLPKPLYDIIPLYSSVFISNLGSIGQEAFHHHLYDWGTTSVFVTMGKYKYIDNKQYLNFTFSIDERIADGYYLANSFKYFTRLLQHPKRLESKAREVVVDDGI